jgi:hypothetical protein
MTFIFKLFLNKQKVASPFRPSILACMYARLGVNGWGV